MKLEEAFAALIKERVWYLPSGVDKRTACRDKKTFSSGGKIPEDRIRKYLQHSPKWQCVQDESWTQIKSD